MSNWLSAFPGGSPHRETAFAAETQTYFFAAARRARCDSRILRRVSAAVFPTAPGFTLVWLTAVPRCREVGLEAVSESVGTSYSDVLGARVLQCYERCVRYMQRAALLSRGAAS